MALKFAGTGDETLWNIIFLQIEKFIGIWIIENEFAMGSHCHNALDAFSHF